MSNFSRKRKLQRGKYFNNRLIKFSCIDYTDKKENKCSSYIRKFGVEQLQSHIRGRAS
jgi:hypothetical protein